MNAKAILGPVVLLALLGSAVFSLGIQGPGEGGFREGFDDDASLPGWEHSPYASVASGVLRIEPGGFAFRPGLWGNLTLEVRARRSGKVNLVVAYRVSDLGEYAVRVGPDAAGLLRNGAELSAFAFRSPPDEWLQLEVDVIGGEHMLRVNGQQVLTATDPDPLPPGGVLLRAEGGGMAEFDTVALTASGPALPPTGTTPIPETDTGEGPRALTSPIPSEAVLVYSDDMRNGMFDLMVPTIDSSGFSVVDEGGGNLAAQLIDNSTLMMRQASWAARTWEDYDLTLRVKRSESGLVGFGFRWIPYLPDAPSVTGRGYWLDNTGENWSLTREVRGETTTLATVEHASPNEEWYELRIVVATTDMGLQVQAFLNSEALLKHTDGEPIPFGGLAFRTGGKGTELWLDDVEVLAQVDSRYTWSQTGGPEGAHDVGAIAIDPRDWRVAYFGGLDSDLYKTTDGGATWTRIGLPNELWTNRFRTIELVPSNPSTIYVGAGGKHVSPLWRSDDGGLTWKWMDVGDQAGMAETEVVGIAIDPSDPEHIFFSISSIASWMPPELLGVYESRDGAISYRQVYRSGLQIGPVEIDPWNPQHILAGSLAADASGYSIIGSTDGGKTWSPSDEGMAGESISQILFYPPDPSYVFAVSWTLQPERGAIVYRSRDGGQTWSLMPSLPRANLVLYSAQTTPTLLAYLIDGLRASTDKGDTWIKIGDPSCAATTASVATGDPNVIYSATSPRIMISRDLGRTCSPTALEGFNAHSVIGLGVAPSDPAVVYAGTQGGLYRSTDYGGTWEFLSPSWFAGIAVDPLDSNTLYVGAVEQAQVLKSTNGGKTWTDVTGPIAFPGISTLAIDPQDRLTIYAGTGHGPQMGPGGAGLYKSTDGGMSWARLVGIPDAAVPAIAIHPRNSNRLAVAAMGIGVFVSIDGGATFELHNTGLATAPDGQPVNVNVWALAMDPRDENVIYAGTIEHAPYGAVGGYRGIYKTTDGGVNWTILLGSDRSSASPYHFINLGGGIDSIAINPARPDEVYVALHDPGIIFSENGGQDWRYVNYGLVPVLTHVYPYRMIISPDGEILYATSCGRSVFRNLINRQEEGLPSVPAAGTKPAPPRIVAPEVSPTAIAPEATPVASPRLPCVGGALPLLAISLLGLGRRRKVA